MIYVSAPIYKWKIKGCKAVRFVLCEQVDVTELIDGHSSYLWATQEILLRLELESYFPVFNKNKKLDCFVAAASEKK